MKEMKIDTNRSHTLQANWHKYNSAQRKDIVENHYGISRFSDGWSRDQKDAFFKAIRDYLSINPSSPQYFTQGDGMHDLFYRILPKRLKNDKPSNVKQFTSFHTPLVVAQSVIRHCSGFQCNQFNYDLFTGMGITVHKPVDESGKRVHTRYLAGGLTYHTIFARVTSNHRSVVAKDGTRGPFLGPRSIELFAVNSTHLDLFVRKYTKKGAMDCTPTDIFPQAWKDLRKAIVMKRVPKAAQPRPTQNRSSKSPKRTDRKSVNALKEAHDHFTVKQLRDMCKAGSLTVSGNKLDLIKRLDKAGKL